MWTVSTVLIPGISSLISSIICFTTSTTIPLSKNLFHLWIRKWIQFFYFCYWWASKGEFLFTFNNASYNIILAAHFTFDNAGTFCVCQVDFEVLIILQCLNLHTKALNSLTILKDFVIFFEIICTLLILVDYLENSLCYFKTDIFSLFYVIISRDCLKFFHVHLIEFPL